MTPEQKEFIKNEYLKCAKDPAYFMKKYCFIQHPTKGRVIFNLYPFQEQVLRLWRDNRYSIINKSRQLGISTLAAGFSLWLMLFHQDKNILCIATKQETAKNMVTKVRFMWDNLPKFLTLGEKPLENNKLNLKLQNGSQIKASSASGDAGRSEAVSMLIIDEAAFINDIESIYTSIKPTISTGGGAIALSSPNGIGNWFHKMWSSAEIGDNDFLPIKLPWDVHPESDDEWFKAECANLSRQKIAQEYECSFLGSGHTVFPQEIIDFYEQTTVKDPIEKRGFDQNFWLWDYPNYSREYMVIGDVARGDGKDYSTIQVMDIDNNEQVAEWKGQLPPKEFANLLISVSTEWNNALLICENTGIGWSTVETLLERNYPKLYFSPKGGEEKTIENYYHSIQYSESNTPGFSMTLKTRPLVISKLREYMMEKSCIIKSKRLIEEIKVFIWKNGRAEAQIGYNDDLIMPFGVSQYLRDTSIKLKQHTQDLQRSMLQNNYKVNHVTQVYKTTTQTQQWQMQNGYGTFDLREWL